MQDYRRRHWDEDDRRDREGGRRGESDRSWRDQADGGYSSPRRADSQGYGDMDEGYGPRREGWPGEDRGTRGGWRGEEERWSRGSSQRESSPYEPYGESRRGRGSSGGWGNEWGGYSGGRSGGDYSGGSFGGYTGSEPRHEYGMRSGEWSGEGRRDWSSYGGRSGGDWGGRSMGMGGSELGSGYSNDPRSGGGYGYGPRGGDTDESRGRWSHGGQSYAGRGPKDYHRSDDRVREEISDRLTDDHQVDASEISIQVQNGEVTLTGTVNDRGQKRRAEDLAESISGVREVTNNIRVSRGQDRAERGQTSGQSGSSTGASGSRGKSSAV